MAAAADRVGRDVVAVSEDPADRKAISADREAPEALVAASEDPADPWAISADPAELMVGRWEGQVGRSGDQAGRSEDRGDQWVGQDRTEGLSWRPALSHSKSNVTPFFTLLGAPGREMAGRQKDVPDSTDPTWR